MSEIVHPLRKYTRPHVKKTTTCPGCGNGIVAQSILRAIDELGLNLDDFVFVSGIGCSAWIPSPLIAVDTLHTTHGRPEAIAPPEKQGRPDRTSWWQRRRRPLGHRRQPPDPRRPAQHRPDRGA